MEARGLLGNSCGCVSRDGLRGTDSWHRRRIDYVLVRSPQLSVRNLRTEQFDDLQVRALSDHAALTGELIWCPAGSTTARR